jgi:hypothetical protein
MRSTDKVPCGMEAFEYSREIYMTDEYELYVMGEINYH